MSNASRADPAPRGRSLLSESGSVPAAVELKIPRADLDCLITLNVFILFIFTSFISVLYSGSVVGQLGAISSPS